MTIILKFVDCRVLGETMDGKIDKAGILTRAAQAGVGVLVVVAIFAIAREARQQSNGHRCKDQLKQIMLAMHNYHDDYHCFPPAYTVGPAGEKLHSWRTLLLPYLGQADLYASVRLDEPWNSSHNQPLSRRPVDVFTCPSISIWSTPQTSYFAVVGRSTAWPEQHSIRIADVADGSSNTISIVESCKLNAMWMEPRDLSREEAIQLFLSDDPASHCHNSTTTSAMVDGAVRRIGSGVDRKVIATLTSIRGGRPLQGVEWPESNDDDSTGEWTTEPTLPKRTEIWPTTDRQIKPDRNLLYCATFQIAWDRARDSIGDAAIRFTTDCPLADQLNEQPFSIGDLSQDAYLADAGLSAVVVPRLRTDFAKRFPGARPRLLDALEERRFLAYAYLYKRLPFETSFDRLKQSLTFAKSNVENFGVVHVDGNDTRHDRLCDEVTVVDYRSPDDFVIKLSPRGKKDEILLAKIQPQETLRETIAVVNERVIERQPKYARPRLGVGETLVVPVLRLNVERSYDELNGNDFANSELSNLYVYTALQTIRFQLDESGAILESEAAIASDDFGPPESKEPRQMIFDKPFLLWLKESQATQPYFVMWIDNDEFMLPFQASAK